MSRWRVITVGAVLLAGCSRTPDDSAILPPVPKGAQAVSLAGRPLFPAGPAPEARRKYEAAREAAEADPGAGILGPKIYYYDFDGRKDVIWTAGGKMRWWHPWVYGGIGNSDSDLP